MKKGVSAYWICQLAGWTFYSLSYIFLAFVFDKLSNLFVHRLVLWMLMGIFFTHLLRAAINLRKLLPPLKGTQWIELFFWVILTCVCYSFITSSIIEWLQLYDPEMKATLTKRFIVDLFSDSPIIIVWTSIYYVWHFIGAARKTEVDRVRMESIIKELQLKTIKSHINPHFIFNALNSIRALVDENPERARTAITELSNILRSSMQAEKLETASLEKELNIVKDYLELECIRFEDRLQVEYHIDDDTLDQQVPPMMLQTLVENAVKHGISKQKEGGLIKIISDFKNNHHELVVQNTGKLEQNSNPEGFGITSTLNRLKLLYGSKADFTLASVNGNIVEARVTIPVNV